MARATGLPPPYHPGPVGRVPPDPARRRALSHHVRELLLAHGREAGAWQILEPGYRWFLHGADACVGYVDTGRAWVAAGAPIAPRARQREVAWAFVESAAAEGRRACFFGVEADFGAAGFDRLRLGEQPEWVPRQYVAQRLRSSLREQHRRARAKGVEVRAVAPTELGRGERGAALRGGLQRLGRRWLQTRRMATLEFVVSLEATLRGLEQDPGALGSRLFVAERAAHDGRELVAAALLLPVPRRSGWYVKHVLRDPTAPNGAVELLVHEVLTRLAREGAEYATLGLAPLAGDVHPALRLARRTLSGAFDFEGLNRFKAKLAPSHATPIHLVHPHGSSTALDLYDSLGAFTPRGPLRFALASAGHRLVRLGGEWRPKRPSRSQDPAGASDQRAF